MSNTIARRDDVNPDEGLHKYGDVPFADPVNRTYPVDTAEHVRAAWRYIHHRQDADKYSAADLDQIKENIRAAAKKFDIELNAE